MKIQQPGRVRALNEPLMNLRSLSSVSRATLAHVMEVTMRKVKSFTLFERITVSKSLISRDNLKERFVGSNKHRMVRITLKLFSLIISCLRKCLETMAGSISLQGAPFAMPRIGKIIR